MDRVEFDLGSVWIFVGVEYALGLSSVVKEAQGLVGKGRSWFGSIWTGSGFVTGAVSVDV